MFNALDIARQKCANVAEEIEELEWFIRCSERLLAAGSDINVALEDETGFECPQPSEEFERTDSNVIWLTDAANRRD